MAAARQVHSRSMPPMRFRGEDERRYRLLPLLIGKRRSASCINLLGRSPAFLRRALRTVKSLGGYGSRLVSLWGRPRRLRRRYRPGHRGWSMPTWPARVRQAAWGVSTLASYISIVCGYLSGGRERISGTRAFAASIYKDTEQGLGSGIHSPLLRRRGEAGIARIDRPKTASSILPRRRLKVFRRTGETSKIVPRHVEQPSLPLFRPDYGKSGGGFGPAKCPLHKVFC